MAIPVVAAPFPPPRPLHPLFAPHKKRNAPLASSAPTPPSVTSLTSPAIMTPPTPPPAPRGSSYQACPLCQQYFHPTLLPHHLGEGAKPTCPRLTRDHKPHAPTTTTTTITTTNNTTTTNNNNNNTQYQNSYGCVKSKPYPITPATVGWDPATQRHRDASHPPLTPPPPRLRPTVELDDVEIVPPTPDEDEDMRLNHHYHKHQHQEEHHLVDKDPTTTTSTRVDGTRDPDLTTVWLSHDPETWADGVIAIETVSTMDADPGIDRDEDLNLERGGTVMVGLRPWGGPGTTRLRLDVWYIPLTQQRASIRGDITTNECVQTRPVHLGATSWETLEETTSRRRRPPPQQLPVPVVTRPHPDTIQVELPHGYGWSHARTRTTTILRKSQDQEENQDQDHDYFATVALSLLDHHHLKQDEEGSLTLTATAAASTSSLMWSWPRTLRLVINDKVPAVPAPSSSLAWTRRSLWRKEQDADGAPWLREHHVSRSEGRDVDDDPGTSATDDAEWRDGPLRRDVLHFGEGERGGEGKTQSARREMGGAFPSGLIPGVTAVALGPGCEEDGKCRWLALGWAQGVVEMTQVQLRDKGTVTWTKDGMGMEMGMDLDLRLALLEWRSQVLDKTTKRTSHFVSMPQQEPRMLRVSRMGDVLVLTREGVVWVSAGTERRICSAKETWERKRERVKGG